MSERERRAGEAVRMRVPFDPASAAVVREELRSWLARHGTDERIVDDARLIASELVANALRHARPIEQDVVLVGWWAEDDRLAFEVVDGGAQTLPAQRAATEQATGGRGLQIVAALADRWWVHAAPGSTTVRAVLPLQGDPRSHAS